MGKRMERYEKKRRKPTPPPRNVSQEKRKKKPSLLATFFKIMLSIVLVFCIGAGGAAFAYYKITGGFGSTDDTGEPVSSNAKETSFLDALKKKDLKINVAVFGVDGDGTRTDVMFVVHFDSKEQRTSLVSMPRDTRVTLATDVVSQLEEDGKYYESPTKLNAVHAYAGKERGCEAAVKQLEDILNVEIDHYVKVDLNAFRNIVDAIGGVEVDVPQSMYYVDPVQDLYIDLEAGPQLLDGDKAEQLVRFRKYPMGDIARVEVQQLFLKAFAEKVTSSETILKNLPDYISMLYSDVETDVTLTDALKYVNYVSMVDPTKITMETLPGVPEDINGISYYIYDEDETKTMVDRIFYGIGIEEVEEAASIGLEIEVANGGDIEGLAGRVGDKLEEDGYTVSGVSTYTGDKTAYTRIVVKEAGVGEDLKKYFADAEVVIDDTLLPSNTDIKIILGTGQGELEEEY